ncbi:MAG: LysR substrate-binding domain-containing protein [Casimicrobium sp.]
MQSLRGILNFTRVAELGSFTAAASELGISPVAVSKNISRLEQSLGVRLFTRSTRALALTPEGAAFLEQCRGPLAQLDEACRQASTDVHNAKGVVRVTLVSPVAHLFIVPKLAEFYRRYPDIDLHLELSEEVNPIVSKRFDVGIRMDALTDAAFVARPLGPLRLLLCASPAYVKRYGTPSRLEDISQHAALQLQVSGQEQPKAWVFWHNGAEPGTSPGARIVQPKTRLVSNDFSSLMSACLDGLGISQFPQPMVVDALKRGKLVQLLPQYTLNGLQLFIHYPSRKQLPARVKAFVDFVLEGLSGHEDLVVDPAVLTSAQKKSQRKRAA